MNTDATNQLAPSPLRRRIGFWSGISLFLLVLFGPSPAGMSPEAQRMAATLALMACWWIGESIPLGVTALIPLVTFPLFRIMPATKVAPNYTNHFVFFLLGGFFIALSMQRWNLHTRIALLIIKLIGTSARRLVLGFMLATGFLSMWMSDSATTMMMMPIGVGIIMKIEDFGGDGSKERALRFGACLMLGIAYSANLGGVGTLVGTFPNLVFAGIFGKHFPMGPDITFMQWFKIGFPFAVISIPLAWAFMVTIAFPLKGRIVKNADEVINEEVVKLGRMSRGEWMILTIFVTTALLWVFRKDIQLGDITIAGWSNLIGLDKYMHDSTVAIFMGILCFVLPVNLKKGEQLLDWRCVTDVPWGILLLFGGGFAIAAGFNESGLTGWVGDQLAVLRGIPLPVVVGLIVLITTMLTNVTSNTATTTMMLPILAATAQVLKINPLILMVPTTMAASCAFILPIGTPPEAIVFATGRVSMGQMVKTGLMLSILTMLLITAFVFFVMVPIYNIDLTAPPTWLMTQ